MSKEKKVGGGRWTMTQLADQEDMKTWTPQRLRALKNM